ncbi:MAG: ABC transporter permease subunit [Acholeplasma sp.]|jgi:NitT/TauT family transport system permease protein|nr:MAG: ABC transporter permease subunit [Acholeplasma sp.]
MKTWWTVSSLISIIFIWFIISLVINHPLVLPSPMTVGEAFLKMLIKTETWLILGRTLFRLLLAIALSGCLGILLGSLAGLSPKFSWIIRPYVSIFRTIPVISIIVILLILIGYTLTPYLITFLMVFPIIYQAAYEGITHIDQAYLDIYRLETHAPHLAFKDLYYPLMRPYIILGFLQSIGLGLKVLVMAEYLSQTQNSVGNELYLAKTYLDYSTVFAWTIMLILIALSLEHLIYRYKASIEN